MLEHILGANVTPLKDTDDQVNSLFQTLEPPRTTAFEDVASVGKAIGNAIVHGIYTAQKETVQENSNNNNFQKLTSPDVPSEPILSKPSYSADKNALKIKLSPVNPIRINRTSLPPKTESDSLKNYLRGIVKAKSNLDQNFKYLEEDLSRNDENREGQIPGMIREIIHSVSNMNDKELTKGQLIKSLDDKHVNKLKSPEIQKNTKHPQNLNMLDYVQQHFVPRNTYSNVSNHVQNSQSKPQQNYSQPLFQEKPYHPNFQIKSQKISAPEVEYIPRANTLSEPLRNVTIQHLSEPIIQKSAIIETLPVERQKQTKTRVLTSEIFETVKILEIPKTITSENDLETIHIKAGETQPENVIEDTKFDEIYCSAMAFVEREVTASITEKLVKQHMEEQRILNEKPDVEGTVDASLKSLIESMMAQMILEEKLRNEKVVEEELVESEIGTIILTPGVTPRSSMDAGLNSPVKSTSPRHSMLDSFRQSMKVIEEELSPDSTLRTVPEFEFMSVQVDNNTIETEQIETEQIETESEKIAPIPSGMPEKEKSETEKTVTKTNYSATANSDDEDSVPTFTPLTEESGLISPTISFGQILIEPGELKGNTKCKTVNFDLMMPRIFEEEPGEFNIKPQTKDKQINADNLENKPKIVKRKLETFSIDTMNDADESFKVDLEEMTPIQSESEENEVKPSFSEGEMLFGNKFHKWRNKASSRLSSDESGVI